VAGLAAAGGYDSLRKDFATKDDARSAVENALGARLDRGPAAGEEAAWGREVGALMAAHEMLGGDLPARLKLEGEAGSPADILLLSLAGKLGDRLPAAAPRVLGAWAESFNGVIERSAPFERADKAFKTRGESGKGRLVRFLQFSADVASGREADEIGKTGLTKGEVFAEQFAANPEGFDGDSMVWTIRDAEGRLKGMTDEQILKNISRGMSGTSQAALRRALARGVLVLKVQDGVFDAGALRAEFRADSLEIFALSEDDWSVPEDLKGVVRLLVMLAGNVMQDATGQINEEIERISFVNIQA
jgi:hypothetical protein